jgi:hypothetical protein
MSYRVILTLLEFPSILEKKTPSVISCYNFSDEAKFIIEQRPVSWNKGQYSIMKQGPILYHETMTNTLLWNKGQYFIMEQGPILYYGTRANTLLWNKGQYFIMGQGPILYHGTRANTLSWNKGQYSPII